MKKLTKLEKFGVIAAIIVAGSYFYMKNVYDPQAKALKKTIINLNKVIGKLNSTKKDTSPIEPVKKTIKKRKKELDKFESSLADISGKTGKESEITDVMSKINRLADKSMLGMESIAPNGETKGAFFTWAVFDLEMEGSFDSFMKFLSGLKTMPDPLKVQKINIANENGNPAALKIRLTLML